MPTAHLRTHRGRTRIHVEGIGPRRAKSVPGASFVKSISTWTFPLDMTTARALRRSCPDLTLDRELTRWARAEVAGERRARSLHRLDPRRPNALPRLAEVAPTMHAAMQDRSYQTLVPAFFREMGSMHIGDQPGTGKTLMSYAALIEANRGRRALILAPSKSIRPTWGNQLRQWTGDDFELDLAFADSEVGGWDDREAVVKAFNATDSDALLRILVVNPEMCRAHSICPADACPGGSARCPKKRGHKYVPDHPALFEEWWDYQVMDETHKWMMNANERSSSVSLVARGIQKLPITNAAAGRIGMSGTPFKGKPRRFYGMLHWLRPDKYTSQGRWQETYFETEFNAFTRDGKSITEDLKPEMEDDFNRDLDSIMVRRTKSELRKLNPEWAPPDKIHTPVKIPMGRKQAKAYSGMVEIALARMENGDLSADGHLAQRTRLKQLADGYGRMETVLRKPKTKELEEYAHLRIPEDQWPDTIEDQEFQPTLPSNKWEWLRDAWLMERGITGEPDNSNPIKVIIASQFPSHLRVWREDLTRLGVPSLGISGRTKPRDVDYIQELWQRKWRKGDARVMFLSTTVGTSLTLDAADDMALADETEVPDDQEQTEDRIHRTGRTDHQVNIYHLISEGTCDVALYDDNLYQDELQKRSLDGRRGVEFARRVFEGRLP